MKFIKNPKLAECWRWKSIAWNSTKNGWERLFSRILISENNDHEIIIYSRMRLSDVWCVFEFSSFWKLDELFFLVSRVLKVMRMKNGSQLFSFSVAAHVISGKRASHNKKNSERISAPRKLGRVSWPSSTNILSSMLSKSSTTLYMNVKVTNSA